VADDGGVSVIGSGPVGLAFALFLIRQGVAPSRIAMAPIPADIPEAVAARTLALGLGAWQLLARVATMPAAATIDTVEVSLAGRAGRTRIVAGELGVPALGYVCRYRELHQALLKAAQPHRFASPDDSSAGDTVLIVHADGGTGADAQTREFDQVAVLAELNTGVADPGTAFERFTLEGPLAMLPLPEPRRYSLVWCSGPQAAQRRLEASGDAFTAELSGLLGPRFGRLELARARICAPLVRRARAQVTGENEVWIGNAAQSLHPVAGQGLSLGLRDAFVLARCFDEPDRLERFRRERKRDRASLLTITDTLAASFTSRSLRPIQSWAMAALDLVPAARRRFASTLMFGLR
jgi:2-octaprenyl-6-methoxyphenol hydroxylase